VIKKQRQHPAAAPAEESLRMVLVDTSVWIDHFKTSNAKLVRLLQEGEVATHPFVIGEIACGSLRQRVEILSLLPLLPKVKTASDHEVLELIERHALFGKGIGWIDAHLLAASLLTQAKLWTHDKRLERLAAAI
jgi:predicted nucleic acid-binding protein